jgi:8-oxo-dGTP pyrophosphatase MutT (NUDIX family)
MRLPIDDINDVEVLMVRRKDSMSFTEFVRGKYDPARTDYVRTLIENMTKAEIVRLLNEPFDQIWAKMWTDRRDHELVIARERFEIVKPLLTTASSTYDEAEWGFPKGRRMRCESDTLCAEREFYEETRIKLDDLIIYENIEPYEEIFFGTNNVLYKHTYYIAKLKNNNVNPSIDPTCIEQIREVRALKWFNNIEVIAHIKKYNIERIELFKYVDINIKQIEKKK